MPTTTQPLRERLEQKIYGFGLTIWKEKWEGGNLERWLSNFRDDDSRRQEAQELNMLFLLSKFMFFGSSQVRELLLSLYRDLYKYPIIEKIRKLNLDTTDAAFLTEGFNRELRSMRFLGVGNPSESGVHLLYYFRQENKLHKDLFINSSEVFVRKGAEHRFRFVAALVRRFPKLHRFIPRSRFYTEVADPTIARYVFIDDICGSGSQARGYLGKLVKDLKIVNPQAEVSYFMLFGTEKGVKNVKALGIFDRVEAVFTIDDSFRAFSRDSRYYKYVPDRTAIKRLFARSVAETKGALLVHGTVNETYPLGWADGQLLLALFHNTPDNTLPIFWGETSNWFPIFKRYDKIYSLP